MAASVVVQHFRRCVFTATLKDAAGNNISVSGKTLRAKIGTDNATPLIDINSSAPTALGSSMTLANPTTITLSDNELIPSVVAAGVYPLDICLSDPLQENQLVTADVNRIIVHQSMTGLGV